MSQTKVSIIVPSLDREGQIADCLGSLLAQEMKEIEILCVDAGSGDRTVPVLEEMEKKDKRVRFLSSKRRSCGHLLNLGLQEAQGEYVSFLLSGDVASPVMYGELVRQADARKLDLAECHGDASEELCSQTISPSKEQGWACLPSDGGRGIYRRAFLEEKGIRFSELPGMDAPFFGFRFRAFLHASKAALLRERLWKGEEGKPARPVEADNFFKECDFLQADLASDKKGFRGFGTALGRACCLELHAMLQRFPAEGRMAFLEKAAGCVEELHESRWIDYYGISGEEREMVSRLLQDPGEYGEELLQQEIRCLEGKAALLEAQMGEAWKPGPFRRPSAKEFGSRLQGEQDPRRWFELLGYATRNFLVILTVKDTPGSSMPGEILASIRRAGFDGFQTEVWRTYVGVMYRGRAAFQQAHAKEVRTDFSYRSIFSPLAIEATSQAWRKGNRGDIRINGENCAVNIRGVNIVIYDVESQCVLDSIGFDSHEKGKTRFVHGGQRK
ncbi:MAG: glycosyltransferase family 2 protein [Selenomonadaceae bacterium]|nr:glycosyltransferase family 2 protein [Selenomonadaceae bacterium]